MRGVIISHVYCNRREQREREGVGGERDRKGDRKGNGRMEAWKHERKKKEERRKERMKGNGQIACEANNYGSVVCVQKVIFHLLGLITNNNK